MLLSLLCWEVNNSPFWPRRSPAHSYQEFPIPCLGCCSAGCHIALCTPNPWQCRIFSFFTKEIEKLSKVTLISCSRTVTWDSIPSFVWLQGCTAWVCFCHLSSLISLLITFDIFGSRPLWQLSAPAAKSLRIQCFTVLNCVFEHMEIINLKSPMAEDHLENILNWMILRKVKICISCKRPWGHAVPHRLAQDCNSGKSWMGNFCSKSLCSFSIQTAGC